MIPVHIQRLIHPIARCALTWRGRHGSALSGSGSGRSLRASGEMGVSRRAQSGEASLLRRQLRSGGGISTSGSRSGDFLLNGLLSACEGSGGDSGGRVFIRERPIPLGKRGRGCSGRISRGRTRLGNRSVRRIPRRGFHA